MKTKLKILAPWGMSGSSRAYRVHLIDRERSSVTWFGQDPQLTRYDIKWYCHDPARKFRPRLFHKPPAGILQCPRCPEIKRQREANRVQQTPPPF